MKYQYMAWVEIDLRAVRHNFRQIRRLAARNFVPKPARRKSPQKRTARPDILCIIKADAYGHGMLRVARVLNGLGANFWGVSDVTEGIQLRKNGFKKPILLLGPPLPTQVKDVIDFNLMPTVCTVSLAAALDTYARRLNRKIAVHVKIDTGMGRLGIWHQQARDFIEALLRFSHLNLDGLYTHFPLADTNPKFTRQQIRLLGNLVDELDREGIVIPYIHAANSMGLAGYKSYLFNLVRPGLMIYGQYPSAGLKKRIPLRPAMSVKARIIHVKRVPKGQGISYGHTFIAPRDMDVATLQIGYNDGYLRSLSNKAHVLAAGQRCPVVGRVTMDQIMVDVSAVKSPRVGMEVILLGQGKKSSISGDELASLAGTINYEIVCSLGNRLPRVYKN